MQSSLKKSLYLGLAALTFASVAGASVSATATNANAAKHSTKVAKKHAKKVTYKVTNFDRSTAHQTRWVFKSNGNAAVYSKPSQQKGAKVVASVSTMASYQNSVNPGNFFMVYQSVKASNGKKYYKVVSFDKKIRGYVAASGVSLFSKYTAYDTIDPASLSFVDTYNGSTTTSSVAGKTVYLKNMDRAFLFKNPYAATFADARNTNRVNTKGAGFDPFDATAYKGNPDGVTTDNSKDRATNNTTATNTDTNAFTIIGAKNVKGATGTDYLYVQVQSNKNPLIKGWVNVNNLTTQITINQKAVKEYNAITVNYVDPTTKTKVASGKIYPVYDSYDASGHPAKYYNVYTNNNNDGENYASLEDAIYYAANFKSTLDGNQYDGNDAVTNAASGSTIDHTKGALYGTGYKFVKGEYISAVNGALAKKHSGVVTAYVQKDTTAIAGISVNLYYIDGGQARQLTTTLPASNTSNADLQSSAFVNVANKAKSSTSYTGSSVTSYKVVNENDQFDIANFESTLFANGQDFNKIVVGSNVYTYNSVVTNTNNANSAYFNENGTAKKINGYDTNKNVINVFFTKTTNEPVNSTVITNATVTAASTPVTFNY